MDVLKAMKAELVSVQSQLNMQTRTHKEEIERLHDTIEELQTYTHNEEIEKLHSTIDELTTANRKQNQKIKNLKQIVFSNRSLQCKLWPCIYHYFIFYKRLPLRSMYNVSLFEAIANELLHEYEIFIIQMSKQISDVFHN